jgi:hypothetical protein
MKPLTLIQILAAIAILALAWVAWPAAKPQADHASAPMAATEVSGSHRTRAAASSPAGASAGRRRADTSLEALPSRNVRADEVLARVNERPIQLRDLTALSPGETEIAMTLRQFSSRLQRAIETELTFQAARAQGVELTPAQQQRVDQTGADEATDLEHYKQYGLTWSSSSAEQVEFEKRLLTAQLLEQNLVAKAASVAPSPDPEAQARYEPARRSLLNQLQASANLSKPEPAR